MLEIKLSERHQPEPAIPFNSLLVEKKAQYLHQEITHKNVYKKRWKAYKYNPSFSEELEAVTQLHLQMNFHNDTGHLKTSLDVWKKNLPIQQVGKELVFSFFDLLALPHFFHPLFLLA